MFFAKDMVVGSASLEPAARNRPELIIFPKFLPYDDGEERGRRGAGLISEKQERIKWK